MISIVVVNWNSGPFLERCLSSVRRHAGDCETIVVDNASSDSSADAVGAPFTLIRNASNLGFAGAGNRGWRAAAGDPVLFLNPDAECGPGSVERLAEAFGEGDSVAAVGGALVDSSGVLERSVRGFPTLGSVRAEMLMLDEVWPQNPWTRRYRLGGWNHSSAREIDQPAGACLMVRRAVLEKLDGFDERFHPAWFEDVDLCKRIRDRAGRILYVPGAVFVHHGACSVKTLGREDFLYYFHKNQARYFEKHHGSRAAASVRRWSIAGMSIRAILGSAAPSIVAERMGIDPQALRRLVRRLSAERGDRP